MITLPGIEEPIEAIEDGILTLYFFMESLSRIDPFIFLNIVRNRIIINIRMLREEGEEEDDIPEAPTEPIGSIVPLGKVRSFLKPGYTPVSARIFSQFNIKADR
jgi:hypothetical protein